jgi:hypothetical protein
MRDANTACEARRNYKVVLVKSALFEETLASHFSALADEIEKQGHPSIAEMLQQASHRHRAFSLKSRAIAANIKG